MKICIPTQKPDGLDSIVYAHFGSAPFFIVYDNETHSFDTLDNINSSHQHGQCNPIQTFENNHIDVLVTGGIGARALQRMSEMGVKAFRTEEEKTAGEVIESMKANRLVEMTMNESCVHHDCH